MSSSIILILGAGPNAGIHITKYFSEKSYKIVAVARDPSEEVVKAADLAIEADFSDASNIKAISMSFYFADERFADESPMYQCLNGDVQAEFYYELAIKKEQGPWEATLVKGKGYVDFDGRIVVIPTIGDT